MAKSKPPEYQAQEPAFLQRLKAAHVNGDGRHERPIPRPKRNKVDDEEDNPTYVTDGGENITKGDYEKLLADDTKSTTAVGEPDDDNIRGPEDAGDGKALMSGALPSESKADAPAKQIVNVTIGQKKRKAHAVGTSHSDLENEENAVRSSRPEATKRKTKAIKLAFDVDERS